eukprot:717852-Amorphochlora_amoeboformis.AAC.1
MDLFAGAIFLGRYPSWVKVSLKKRVRVCSRSFPCSTCGCKKSFEGINSTFNPLEEQMLKRLFLYRTTHFDTCGNNDLLEVVASIWVRGGLGLLSERVKVV